MHVVEPLVRDRKLAYWWNGVSVDLRLLTGKALACPFGHVLAHGGPDDLGSDGLSCTFDSGMPEAVNGVKNGLTESQWYEWSCGTIAYVHDEVCLANVDALEIEAGPRVVPEAPEVRI